MPSVNWEKGKIQLPSKIIGLYVRNMILTEFNEEIYEKGIRQEGREEGRVDERERSISSVMESLSCSRDEAMRILKITDFE